MPPLEERTEYPYQNIRVKNFPWGDGDKVSQSYTPPIELLKTQLLTNPLCRPSCKFPTAPSRHTSFDWAHATTLVKLVPAHIQTASPLSSSHPIRSEVINVLSARSTANNRTAGTPMSTTTTRTRLPKPIALQPTITHQNLAREPQCVFGRSFHWS
jgi:hypothetical protein